MAYLVLTFEQEGVGEIREHKRLDHRRYLKNFGSVLLASGATLDDEGANITGGMSILDTNEFTVAKQFSENDPYTLAGLYREVKIIRWRQRWSLGSFLGEDLKY